MNNKFLSAYKELEKVVSLIPESDGTVFWLESQLDIEKQNKLRLCRTARNFIQHNENDNFFVATEEMIGFLTYLIDEYSSHFITCSDKMLKIGTKTKWDVNDKLVDVLESLNKNKTLLIYEGDKFKGIYTAENYLKTILKESVKKTTKINTYTKVKSSKLKHTDEYQKALALLQEGFDVVFVTKEDKVVGYIPK